MTYFQHIERARRPGPFDHPPVRGDAIDFPDMLVTEEEATPEALLRFRRAEERKALELLP
jgi:hypothetical protein